MPVWNVLCTTAYIFYLFSRICIQLFLALARQRSSWIATKKLHHVNCGLATATSEVKQGPDWLFVAKKESGAQTQDLGKKAAFFLLKLLHSSLSLSSFSAEEENLKHLTSICWQNIPGTKSVCTSDSSLQLGSISECFFGHGHEDGCKANVPYIIWLLLSHLHMS